MAIEFPDAKGLGGTTTTTESARKVYSSVELRNRISNLVDESLRTTMEEVLLNDYAIMRIASCPYRIIVWKLRDLLTEQQLLLVEELGEYEVRFPETIHEAYAHLADLIGRISVR